MAKKFKKGKRKAKGEQKPQPLPRSVKALLSYLGTSDVKMGAAARPQPAQIAPATRIYIQMPQSQQYVRSRVAPKGEKVGVSPLAGVIPQQPVIIQQQPQSTAEIDRKIQAAEREASQAAVTINRKMNVLEASQQQFRQAAVTAYQEVKDDLSRRVVGDANIFDARNLAQHFSPSPRPILEEQRFGGNVQASPLSRTPMIPQQLSFGGAIEEEDNDDLGEYLGEQYVNQVSNPEMTKIVRGRGRPKLSEEEKQSRAAARKAAKTKPSAPSQAEISSSASLLDKKAEDGGGLAGFTAVPAQGYLLRDRPKIALNAKPRINVSSDMATQIQMLTSGGAAAVNTPRRGKTIAELMGSISKK
jgi:hypothetical protein